MNRSARTLIVLIVALGAAAASSYAVYRALQHLARPAAVATTPTVIAAREVPAGTMLTAEDVMVVSWPSGSRVPNAFSSVEEAVGRGTIDVLRQHEPLTPGKVAARGGGAGLPPTIPAGMRAISIRVNEVIGVAGFVVPGSRVDVLVTLDNREVGNGRGQDQSQSTTRMVVSNVVVLTAGSKFDQDKSRKDGKPIPTSVVTLQVTPDDAERIALAQNEGKINLTLRNPLDSIASATPGVTLAHLLGKQTTPPPVVDHQVSRKPRALAVVPPPIVAEAKPYTIETIRAAKRTEETLK
jgi:pilus assembly protein CpaB